jgi:hypothetical protein
MLLIAFGSWPVAPNWSTSEWAAVVQAVGSVLAILASGWLAIWAPQFAEEQRFKASQARRVLALLSISEEIAAIANGADHLVKSKAYHSNSSDHIRIQLASLRNELDNVAGVEFPPSLRIHIIRAKAAADVLDRVLSVAEAAVAGGAKLPENHFELAVQNAKRVGPRLKADLEAHPVGRTKMKGFV